MIQTLQTSPPVLLCLFTDGPTILRYPWAIWTLKLATGPLPFRSETEQYVSFQYLAYFIPQCFLQHGPGSTFTVKTNHIKNLGIFEERLESLAVSSSFSTVTGQISENMARKPVLLVTMTLTNRSGSGLHWPIESQNSHPKSVL
ncbi:hypothetical protein J6590_077916 [Homalodisca vitripennis]|nr:hypothetical protein J6590_037024 [Homalodisca vitripennis]KAG8261259.1 hypothetical protein J6590_077916 [Homalodisca vitripennis]